MQDVLLTMVRLACPVGMGVMMWMMMRGHRPDAAHPAAGDPTTPIPVATDSAGLSNSPARQEVSRA